MAQQPHWARAFSLPGFTITRRHTTIGRTPLDEWSFRRRDFYLIKQNTQKRQTSMPTAGFEPAIPVSEEPCSHALNRKDAGIGISHILHRWIKQESTNNYSRNTKLGLAVLLARTSARTVQSKPHHKWHNVRIETKVLAHTVHTTQHATLILYVLILFNTTYFDHTWLFSSGTDVQKKKCYKRGLPFTINLPKYIRCYSQKRNSKKEQ
jgi:hypothetical protein